MEDSVHTVIKAASSGIPHLYEWGGLVTLLTLFTITAGFAIFGLCWVIWQMYKQNQKMFEDSLKSSSDLSASLNDLSTWIKGSQGRP